MEPKVIGSFGAAGDDGERYAVEVVRRYNPTGGGRWQEDALAEFRTTDGREVSRAGEGADGYFWVIETGAKLTPDISLEEIMEMISGDWKAKGD